MTTELTEVYELVRKFGLRAFEDFSKEKLSRIETELKRVEGIQLKLLNDFLLKNPDYPIPEEYEENLLGFWESLNPDFYKINQLKPFLEQYFAKEFKRPNQYFKRREEFYSSQQYKDLFCKTEYSSEDSYPIPFSSKVEEVLQLGFIDSLELLIRLESDIQLCLIDMKEENVSLGWWEEDAYSDKLKVVRLLKIKYSSSSDTQKQIPIQTTIVEKHHYTPDKDFEHTKGAEKGKTNEEETPPPEEHSLHLKDYFKDPSLYEPCLEFLKRKGVLTLTNEATKDERWQFVLWIDRLHHLGALKDWKDLNDKDKASVFEKSFPQFTISASSFRRRNKKYTDNETQYQRELEKILPKLHK